MSLTCPTKAMQRPLGGTQCSLSVPGVCLSSSLAPNSELILFARAVRTLGFFSFSQNKTKNSFDVCSGRRSLNKNGLLPISKRIKRIDDLQPPHPQN